MSCKNSPAASGNYIGGITSSYTSSYASSYASSAPSSAPSIAASSAASSSLTSSDISSIINKITGRAAANGTDSFMTITTKGSTTKGSTTKGSTTKGSTTKGSTTKGSTTKGSSTTKASTTKASTTKASTTKGSTTKGSPTKASTTSPPSSSTSIPPLSPLPAGSSKCPANFRNAVFNTVATKDSGWSSRWSTIAGFGVSNWIGFTMSPISKTQSYNNAPSTPAVDSAQMKICMDPSMVSAAVTLITGPSPPKYLGLFNEPDFSFMGYTPLTDAVSAATALAPIFSATTTTQFLAPAVAFTNSDWLSTFAAHCNNCMDKIPIISAHVYAADPAAAINQIEILHSTWPSKRIWVTELAPASSNDQGCNLDDKGVIGWMQTVVPRIVGLGYVDRIFWNTGEHSSMSPCNPSLTNADGTATDLLKAYGSICS